jgi:tRNA(fMet)-specific endonuclease VapC
LTLLDANTIVHYIKGNPGVVEKLHASSPGQLAVPSIVVYELERGCLQNRSTKRRTLISSVLRDLEVVAFDQDAALEAAKIHYELGSKGILIGPMDLLIAGIARHHRALLVTNNIREFSRIRGLRTADWRTA